MNIPSRIKVFFVFLIASFFVGCGGNGGDDTSGGDTTSSATHATYSINFYDKNLDLIDTVSANESIITLVDIKSGSWYKAGKNSSIVTYNLTSDIRLYAVANVTEITNQDELDYIRDDLNGKYILLNDIALDENGTGFDNSTGWNPIGYPLPFKGIFNGNFHKITNLWINRPSDSHIGFFGYAYNAKIRNLGIEIAEGKEIKGYRSIGGVAGYIEYSSIINSYSIGNISGNYGYVGGVIGDVVHSYNIANIYSIGNVSGNISSDGGYVGGVAGRVEYGNITNSYSIGNINGNGAYAGGIAGGVTLGNITNSYSIGNVSGSYSVGGIVGLAYKSSVKNNAAINLSVTGKKSYHINRAIGSINIEHSDIFNFARKALASGFNNFEEGNAYSGDGKVDGAFLEEDTYKIDLNWKFGDDNNNPWKIDININNGYPYFYYQKL
ncbi:MAG: hypothetical protein LBG21_07540 [Campylobacteraceae bacterium]|jgi:hypothetical protein|nr:hypothetical protein [Campylobacteraceae bacterium]